MPLFAYWTLCQTLKCRPYIGIFWPRRSSQLSAEKVDTHEACFVFVKKF